MLLAEKWYLIKSRKFVLAENKVDFNDDEQLVLFDDENGKRHVVYFKTGTIVIDEVD